MKHEVSAGGIVYKQDKNSRLWLVVQHATKEHWGFPKGKVADIIAHETLEEASVREVLEEGGVCAQIKNKIATPSRYTYIWRGEKVQKTVWYFVMKYISGSVEDHDKEIKQAQFIEETHVASRLSYTNDRHMFQRTLEYMDR